MRLVKRPKRGGGKVAPSIVLTIRRKSGNVSDKTEILVYFNVGDQSEKQIITTPPGSQT
jgi:hypothetical protein